MKITDVKAVVLDAPQCRAGDALLVEVETDEGITGLGEACSHYGSSPPVKAIVEGFKPILVGEDPLDVQRLWEKMYNTSYWYGRRGAVIFALSGIDIALMDIMGKASGLPIHKLLGGCYRDKIRVYASAVFDTENPDKTAKEAAGYVEEGFTAVKFGGLTMPPDPDKDLEMVRSIREAVGDDVDLLIDVGADPPRGWSASYAIQMTRKLEEYNIYWLEEPLPRDDLDGYVRLAEAVDTFIAAGEGEQTQYGFKELIVRKAVDIIQPDIGKAGGLSECKKIANMAHLWNIPCVPHSWSTAVNTAAGLHLVASMPDGFLLEFRKTPSPLMTELLAEPLEVKDGYVKIPMKPGLGVELNREAVERYTVS